MSNDLSNRTVIVTGAAGGIGRKVVDGLLTAGSRVFAVDLVRDALDVLQVGQGSSRLYCMAADLTDAAAPARILAEAKAVFGSVNALINNAGIGRSIYTRDIIEGSPAAWNIPHWAWEKMFRVNTISAIHLSNAVVPEFLAQGDGSLVFVTTSLNSMINAGTGPYGPSKAALEAFAAALVDELRDTPITVNVVIPGGVVDTPMIPDQRNFARSDFLNPEIMVSPIRYLLSDAGRKVTGWRIRANLWQELTEPARALQHAGAPIAWSSIASGQRRTPPKSP
jgi:3-oxoacyl-[acyl-carrier protein] reductase